MPRVVPSEIVRVIDRYFPAPWVTAQQDDAAKLDESHAGPITAILGLVDRLPAHLVTLDTQAFTDFVAAVETARSWIPMWHAHGSGKTFKGEAVRTMRRLLAACPDEYPPPTVHDLAFIPDADLRESLRLDIEHAERALVNDEWKGATVIGGSVIEALLLWKLQSLPAADVSAAEATLIKGGTINRKPNPDLTWWHLHDYIEVAATLPAGKPAITADTAKLLRLAKDFRNLIHPGKTIRVAQRADRRTALTAIAGVVGVINDLTR